MRTPQQAMKDAREAREAWEDGRQIQVRMVSQSPEWLDLKNGPDVCPKFTDPSYEFRVKPTPKPRPWKPEEVPHLARIRRKSWPGIEYSTIVGIGEGSIEYTTGGGCDSVRFDSALEHFTYSTDGGKTWAPCGVMEDGE